MEPATNVGVGGAGDRVRVEGVSALQRHRGNPTADSVLVLLSTEPQRVLETIVSRCLRLSFGEAGPRLLDAAQREWLDAFSELAGKQQKSLMSRYRLLDVLLRKLTALRAGIEESLTARSPP